MKKYLFFLAILLVSYMFLMCSSKEEHSHSDHSHEQQDNSHTDDPNHDHEGHSNDHGEEHSHTSDDHENENSDHEHTDNTQDDDEHEHIHDDGNAISVGAEWERLIGLKTFETRMMPIELVISVPGQIISNQNKIATVSPFIESSINCIFVNVGDRVEKGDLLACLVSPQIGILRAEYYKAKAELDIIGSDYKRKEKLYKENIISNKSYQKAELDLKVAQVNYNYAQKKLISMGVKGDELENEPKDHGDAVGSTFHIYAPIAGIITERNAKIGQKVDQSTELFEIINLNTVWVEADIFEKDLKKVELGQTVKINVSAFENKFFTGIIFHIASTLNKETKTIKILVEISNEDEKLKPGMFANTNIVVGTKENTIVIPKIAILEDENLNIVFVKEQNGYHRHVVQIGIISDQFTEILTGLKSGDEVVTRGNYQLKSKLKMSSIDPHAGHSH